MVKIYAELRSGRQTLTFYLTSRTDKRVCHIEWWAGATRQHYRTSTPPDQAMTEFHELLRIAFQDGDYAVTA